MEVDEGMTDRTEIGLRVPIPVYQHGLVCRWRGIEWEEKKEAVGA